MMYPPWFEQAPRCTCGAVLVSSAPLDGGLQELRRRLREEVPALWIDAHNVRLLVLDGDRHADLPMVVHQARGDERAATLTFVGPWIGEQYLNEGLLDWSYPVTTLPAAIAELLQRLTLPNPPVISVSGSLLRAIHAAPGGEWPSPLSAPASSSKGA